MWYATKYSLQYLEEAVESVSCWYHALSQHQLSFLDGHLYCQLTNEVSLNLKIAYGMEAGYVTKIRCI